MFSDHNGIELEINNRKIAGKFPERSETNSTLLNNNMSKKKSQKKLKKKNVLNQMQVN